MDIPILSRWGVVVAFTQVDADDLAFATQWTWRLLPKGYAFRRTTTDTIYLHRELLGLSRGDRRQVDHINRDGLDNRRSNLRIVTAAQNRQNIGSTPGSYSRHRGVTYNREERRWAAQAQLNGHHVHIGRFATEDEAAKAARRWRREHMPFSVDDDV